MPTVLEIFGFRFFFFGGDHEPIHIHVLCASGEAKIALVPEVEVVYNKGLKKKELKKALDTVVLYREDMMEAWKNFMKVKKDGKDKKSVV